jgi:hypothetical protein
VATDVLDRVPSSRWKSPLRWLWTVIGSLAVVGAAGLTGAFWLLLLLPVVWALFLLAPPLGVFRHDESRPARASLRLELVPAEDAALGALSYWIELVNGGDAPAEGFALRLLVSEEVSPRGHPVRPLGRIVIGELGRQWYLESVEAATALTFRSGDEIAVASGSRLRLAELRLPAGRSAAAKLDYQISGGTAAAVLGEVELPAAGASRS